MEKELQRYRIEANLEKKQTNIEKEELKRIIKK